MVTTIQISQELKAQLEKRKLSPKDSYEDIIWDMYEDTAELSAETKRRIELSLSDAEAGRVVPFSEVMKKAGL